MHESDILWQNMGSLGSRCLRVSVSPNMCRGYVKMFLRYARIAGEVCLKDEYADR